MMGQVRALHEKGLNYYDLKAFLDNKTADVFHGFFGRQGGVSTGVYNSLNCGFGSDDEPDNVKENRSKIAREAGVDPEKLLTVYQEHGTDCVQVTESWAPANAPKADAMVTNLPGFALGVLSADCAPVLFYCANNGEPIIGAAHAGWRGALAGVLESTVAGMKALGAKPENIRACIGPCIDRRSYEVGQEFLDSFLAEAEENERFFTSVQKDGHYMFDLAGYCANRLYKIGLSRIYIKDLDTYFNEDDFFSCRRAAHRNESDYGRQLSVICIKPQG